MAAKGVPGEQHDIHGENQRAEAKTETDLTARRVGEPHRLPDIPGEQRDKAGSYAIQGKAGAWIKRIEGSYTGVMGLPLFETAKLLRDMSN